MSPTNKNESTGKDKVEELSLSNRDPLQTTNNMDYMIKNLSSPRFMGSIHMKKDMSTNSNIVTNLVENELNLKISKSLKNTLFNPVTKILILLAIIFNLTWLFFVYIL
ncbi:MAG: hypothetical protein ACFFDY_09155 [Candidatus Thorarchaeota archaeon]